MALLTLSIDPAAQALPEHIIHKHWERKHGTNAYYGQK
jgi:ribulose-5-phosphate 4-epimerase/fuculose-1-phosphate aldolase